MSFERPPQSGCSPMIAGFIAGILVVWAALCVMNGLTQGGIWK